MSENTAYVAPTCIYKNQEIKLLMFFKAKINVKR